MTDMVNIVGSVCQDPGQPFSNFFFSFFARPEDSENINLSNLFPDSGILRII